MTEQRDWTPTTPTPDNYDPAIPETWELAEPKRRLNARIGPAAKRQA